MSRPAKLLCTAISATVLAATGSTAQATPPEGCVGLPSVPEAFVCVTQWTPDEALPTVSMGPDQTYTVPEFCVFECVGPTPVTVPGVTVTPGTGVIAVITYNGQTYEVAVPPTGTVEDTVELAQQQVSDAVTAVLDAVGAAVAKHRFTFSGTASINCYGCEYTSGSLAGSATTVVAGVPSSGSATGTFSAVFPRSTCPATGSAQGTMTLPEIGPVTFSWTIVGGVVVMTYSAGTMHGDAVGSFVVTSPVGNACGITSAAATVVLAGQGG